MKRRHSRTEALEVVAKLRALRPDMVFGADIIAGFPTETDEMFENTLRIVTAADLTFLHVFPYSPRPGTPAAKMPQVDRRIARDRAALLRAEGDRQYAKFCESRLGEIETVLVEREGLGRTEQFVPIEIGGFAPGSIVPVRAVGVTRDGLVGEPMRTAA
jgi:threonylcarbamoyladenosine tRNA methylthiotransferase MtaB